LQPDSYSGDPQLVEIGKEYARRVDAYGKKQFTTLLGGLHGNGIDMSNVAELCPRSLDLNSKINDLLLEQNEGISDDEGRSQVMVSTCKVPIRIGRSPDVVHAILDTGASKSAITKDTLRRLGLLSKIEPTFSHYYNADGRRTQSLGKISNLVVTLGRLNTKLCFSVTDALSYDVLLGMDFLKHSGAILDLRSDNIRYDLGDGLEGVYPLKCHVTLPPLDKSDD
jgi:hypothetical protein